MGNMFLGASSLYSLRFAAISAALGSLDSAATAEGTKRIETLGRVS